MSEIPDRRHNLPLGDTGRILAIMYIFAFQMFILGLFFVPIPPNNKDAILTILGITSTVQAAIIG